ncbi:hypothetical protein JK333_18330 [Klebsiella michiganensis]|uniref:hypothetical protein n=1 Tax=Klebsiella michiganensis TaxID=1134687 RepID=UPI00191D28B1|nr:hypothetical protein [Klebsiella michiganensis]MBL0791017.1 hypothetical protein [Klebsiella michiganensis]MDU6586988.1 hypothetical protein [Klebsiella michiganensis]
MQLVAAGHPVTPEQTQGNFSDSWQGVDKNGFIIIFNALQFLQQVIKRPFTAQDAGGNEKIKQQALVLRGIVSRFRR